MGIAGAAVLAGGLIIMVGQAPGAAVQAAAQAHSREVLFNGGDESLNGVEYHSFRVPSLTRTKAGTLLAFAEGRVSGNRDHGNINVVYKRSTDQGATWSGLLQVVGVGQGKWGNPTPVADQLTGKIWLFMTWMPEGYSQRGEDGTKKISKWEHRKVFLSGSEDDGRTWSDPVDMSERLKPRTKADGSAWVWDVVGPGAGVQTTVSKPGRLIIPAVHRHIYSDDGGRTWQMRLITDQATGTVQEKTTESSVVELADGRLYRNDRVRESTWETAKRRWVAWGGIEEGFTRFEPDMGLLDPRMHASTLRYTAQTPRLMFLNSASTDNRGRMRLRISYDGGQTWPVSRAFDQAPLPQEGNGYMEGGYSSMAKTTDAHVGALVEINENTDQSKTSHRSISFRKLNLPWILDGATEPPRDGSRA
ncbi:sialidase family protein [Actinomadura vinacea]|uniref:exo-alpha-sialidase n=2 Tax=Actinomadura vinacea TaxID=115336 RepID=A0ABN3ICH3_9ACTN